MNPKKDEDKIFKVMNDPQKVLEILQLAINEALLKHKQAGNPVCGSKNGEVFWLNPDEIPVKKL